MEVGLEGVGDEAEGRVKCRENLEEEQLGVLSCIRYERAIGASFLRIGQHLDTTTA